jgi:iron-sulfur cluster repair protein YtfE (RIC family)
MRNGSYAHSAVETIARKLPEARALLREARIDSTASMRLADAALATSTNVDELLAVLEDRLRRQARRATRRPAHVEAEEYELV